MRRDAPFRSKSTAASRAALPLTRTLPMNPPKIWDGQRWGNDGKNIFVRPKSLGFFAFRFRGSRHESGLRGILSSVLSPLVPRGERKKKTCLQIFVENA